MKYITRSVWVLSIISLFTDTASEMLYPIMPIYLKSIGFSIVLIGILEGVAEATAGLSKGYFGQLSDQLGRRVPFVQIGYGLSALSKPMMAFFIHPIWIFFTRTIDRFGKGIRTGARDALLSDEATPATKGKVFGFHRSMDTFGAVLGPLLALFYLYFYPKDYRTLFYIAFIPGLLALIASFFLGEKKPLLVKKNEPITFLSFLSYWKKSSVEYRKLVLGLLVFTLFNSSDVFLLLKAKASGLNDTWIIGLYIFYNLIYALFAFPMGILADKIGLKKTYSIGLLFFAIVYLGMATTCNAYVLVAWFLLYGLYAAATEGISKAWISNISAQADIATAIGTYSAFQSICTMLASSLAGLIWWQFGSAATLALSGVIALLMAGYFVLAIPALAKT